MAQAQQVSPRLPGRRLTRDERSAEKRELLLAAAWEVALERGWSGATVEEIALRAGYSRQPIYTAFGGKEGLALLMVLQIADRGSSWLEQRLDRSGPVTEVAARIGSLHAAWTAEPEYRLQVELTVTVMGALVRDRALRERYHQTFVDLVDRYAEILAAADMVPDEQTGVSQTLPDPAGAAQALVALLMGLGTLAGNGEPVGAIDPQVAADACRRLIEGFSTRMENPLPARRRVRSRQAARASRT